jgi:glycosyltransferase involved in cell wall biosynthesis
MRIIFLTREYPPDTLWGGQAIACYDMTHFLCENNYDTHVICQAVEEPQVVIDRGVFVHRVGRNHKRYSVTARIDYSFHALLKLAELMKTNDTIVVEGFYGESDIFLYAAFKFIGFFRKPLFLHAHGSIRHAVLNTQSYKGVIGLLYTKLLLLLADCTARSSDVVVAISPTIREEMLNESQVNPRKVILVFTPRDDHKFRFVKSDIREKLGLVGPCGIILAVGRLEIRKGTHILFRAIPLVLESFPNTKFVLVGSDTPTGPCGGSFKNFLMEMAGTKGYADAIFSVDNLSDEDLVKLYSASSVVVSPSLYEVSTSVPIEAMLCGRPVVVTRTGIAEQLWLDGVNGVIVPPGDHLKLSQGILEMLRLSKEERSKVSVMNREIIEKNFSFNEWAAKVLEFHNKF